MTLLKAVILGIVQGLTEFLPISSSGHLVIFQHLFGLREPQLLFDILVHIGTLLAVLAVFFGDIVTITRDSLTFASRCFKKKDSLSEPLPGARLLMFIIIGTVPTALIGYFLEKKADVIFSSLRLVGLTLLATGVLLWLTKRFSPDKRDISRMNARDSLLIGLVQGIAVIPGISRSGSTIAAGLFMGLDRSLAARFSFLLSIPAILGALVLKSGELFSLNYSSMLPDIVGMLAAFVSGYFALKFLIRIVLKGNFYLFAYYCFLVGLLILMGSTVFPVPPTVLLSLPVSF
jgi:undecaprenyl-diphosphatase